MKNVKVTGDYLLEGLKDIQVKKKANKKKRKKKANTHTTLSLPTPLLICEVIKVIQRDNLLNNVKVTGDYLLAGLKNMQVNKSANTNSLAFPSFWKNKIDLIHFGSLTTQTDSPRSD